MILPAAIREGCIFPSTKTASVVKAFEIGHRWHWGPHFCAEEYGVASDNVDGGGKDVYEKNEIISVVTTKKEDARLLTIIDLFAYTLVTLRQTRGRSVEKTGLPEQKEDIYGAPMRFLHWGRNFLEVLCFSPRESPLFFLLSDTKHLRRRGKNTIFRFAFPWNFDEFDGFRWQPLFVACNFEKFFRECVVKAGDASFFWGVWFKMAKCAMVSASSTERRKLLLLFFWKKTRLSFNVSAAEETWGFSPSPHRYGSSFS